jgi:hypothetical protein
VGFLENLGKIVRAGINSLNFSKLNGSPRERFDVQTPDYPFQWSKAGFEVLWPRKVLPRALAVVGHVGGAGKLLHTVAAIEMALELPGIHDIHDVRFFSSQKNSIPDNLTRIINIQGNTFYVYSSPAMNMKKASKMLHCSGKLSRQEIKPDEELSHVDPFAVLQRCNSHFEADQIYQKWQNSTYCEPESRRILRMSANK